MNTSRSQSREDIILLPTLLSLAGLGKPGVFVELGANDGVTFSNTLALEACLGWRGLLIEANPANYGQLATSGRAASVQYGAVCADAAGSTINVSLGGGLAAGMHLPRGELMRKSFHISHTARGSVAVPCWPLGTLMTRHGDSPTQRSAARLRPLITHTPPSLVMRRVTPVPTRPQASTGPSCFP